MTKTLGCFSLGFEFVTLEINTDNDNGKCLIYDEIAKRGKITIGIQSGDISLTTQLLIHEAMEYSLLKLRSRFSNSLEMGADSAAYMFMFNHTIFTEACSWAGEYVHESLDILIKEVKKYNEQISNKK